MSNAEIVWFVVSYEPTAAGWRMVPGKAVFTKLESSIRALTGGSTFAQREIRSAITQQVEADTASKSLVIRLIGLYPPSQSRFLPIRSSVIFAW